MAFIFIRAQLLFFWGFFFHDYFILIVFYLFFSFSLHSWGSADIPKENRRSLEQNKKNVFLINDIRTIWLGVAIVFWFCFVFL